MSVGTSGINASSDIYNSYVKASEKKENTKAEENTSKKEENPGAVFEKTEAPVSKEPYKINKMSKEERASLISSMKADLEARENQLQELVKKMLGQQAQTAGIAAGKDDIWKIFASGNFTVDEAARAQAEKDIAEDGYWGVKQTSERLFDFASALAGDDEEKMKKMQEAMHKGYEQATKAWGKELPDISKKSIEAADKLFEEYYASKKNVEE